MKKHIVILCDGMADYNNAENRTPMKDAKKPMMDYLAFNGEVGLCRTVPTGMKPGSDVANLSVMGYEPEKYYTGRSPLEALSIGVKMEKTDISYRANLVTLSEEEDYENKTMMDYSSGEITTQEASQLISYLKQFFNEGDLMLYSGISYRHCLLRKNGNTGAILTPPHDISDKKITEYLPKGEYKDEMLAIMKRSYELLSNHPINRKRKAQGLNPANSLWFWGEGRKPALDSFEAKYGVKGAVISAVDLIKGIGIGANMTSIDVEGATGTIKTNFEGKANAAISALKNHDYVYVHLEAPDECGHQGNYKEKVESLELIDEKIITPIVKHLKENNIKFNILICPDHATPISLKTHVSDPVPYLIYDSEKKRGCGVKTFDEDSVKTTRCFLENGSDLIKKLLNI
ncbi:MAG: cofactor-independent phosphoglycerate mutase [Clostridia bacterium]|nr:cofactor-independent phosphoglycerate mutase [Clostridia bacterium]